MLVVRVLIRLRGIIHPSPCREGEWTCCEYACRTGERPSKGCGEGEAAVECEEFGGRGGRHGCIVEILSIECVCVCEKSKVCYGGNG
jgi:hypothetical protein